MHDIFIAGATGTLGLPLVRRLVAGGHRVTGLTRKESGRRALEELGATGVIGDALDAPRLRELVVRARPTHVLHLLTAIPKAGVTKPSDLAPTNELRTRGTAHLIDAAIAAGATRIIAESYPSVYGSGVVSDTPLAEDAPLAPVGDSVLRPTIEALRDLERRMRDANGRIDTIVLRYGSFYGPGVPSTDALVDALRKRKMPVMRGADGVSSFVHIDDAVAATIAALDRGAPGSVYNIVDDAPANVAEMLAAIAGAAGAPRPFALPRFVARLVAPMLVEYMTARLPLSNAKAKRELGFAPRFPDYRTGLAFLRTAGITYRGTSSSRNVRQTRY